MRDKQNYDHVVYLCTVPLYERIQHFFEFIAMISGYYFVSVFVSKMLRVYVDPNLAVKNFYDSFNIERRVSAVKKLLGIRRLGIRSQIFMFNQVT